MPFKMHYLKLAIAPISLAVFFSASACQPSVPEAEDTAPTPTASPRGEATPSPTASPADVAMPAFEDVPSPAGGTVKQVTIPGPEAAVLVTCDQEGFEPFLYEDQGDWVGCELSQGAQPGAASALTEPDMEQVPGPVGGTVQQVTIPGPEAAVMVMCGQAGFAPFVYTDQGNWIGCQGS